MVNEHITSLGYRLEYTDDPSRVEPLLRACSMNPLPIAGDEWEPAKFLLACTMAGGTAACIGWNRRDEAVVLHSLAVAPTSRGSGIGAGLLASAMGDIMDRRAVPAMYLITDNASARRLFRSAGFSPVDLSEVPDDVQSHPAFESAPEAARPMIRRYQATKRGLDNCAFRLILNDTDDATLPPGSVFFFRQTGEMLESSYRGGTVRRGHLIGSISGDELRFCWHQFLEDGNLQSGDGTIFVEMLPDGRRELRETLSNVDTTETNELLLREV